MPELPEVESIVRTLRTGGPQGAAPLPGLCIRAVTLRWPRHVAAPNPRAFTKRIQGRVIRDVQRRGKYLVFPLDELTLLIHLKMSGDLVLARQDRERDRFERTVFHLDRGWELRFNDARKFGKIYLLEQTGELLEPLGPEPLDPSFTPRRLFERLSAHRRPLKPLLLDQTFLAGLGNIYADEALHRARLHPLRRSDTLTEQEARQLWRGIRDALRQGIRHNGASLDWAYRGGEFQNYFRVYQRTGEPCPVCRAPIRRSVIGQRSAHYCPSCQAE